MDRRNKGSDAPVTALLISPNREIAERFLAVSLEVRAFQILADMKSYLPQQTMDIRLRQLMPDVVLVDVATNPEAAAEIIRTTVNSFPATMVVGLHTSNDSQAILGALRLGATEFLYAPFDPAVVCEAASRVRRLKRADGGGEPERGKVIAFASTKPGSGASTLAMQTAFALRKLSAKRTLLVDCDLAGGTVGFCLKLQHDRSLADALEQADQMDARVWSALIVSHGGLDVLPAPEAAGQLAVDAAQLHQVLEYARAQYDWVVLDLPTVFHRLSLVALTESDQTFLVSTTELPSLHLTRKAIRFLAQLGIGQDRFRLILNRTSKREGIGGSDMEKIFQCTIHTKLPNDYLSLHRVVAMGEPLGNDCELGKAIEGLAGKLCAGLPSEKKKGRALMQPALAQL